MPGRYFVLGQVLELVAGLSIPVEATSIYFAQLVLKLDSGLPDPLVTVESLVVLLDRIGPGIIIPSFAVQSMGIRRIGSSTGSCAAVDRLMASVWPVG